MAEGRNRRLWDHTATIAAAALSAFRDEMVDPAKLHPYERGRRRTTGIPITAANIGLLKTMFVDGKKKARKTKKPRKAKKEQTCSG